MKLEAEVGSERVVYHLGEGPLELGRGQLPPSSATAHVSRLQCVVMRQADGSALVKCLGSNAMMIKQGDHLVTLSKGDQCSVHDGDVLRFKLGEGAGNNCDFKFTGAPHHPGATGGAMGGRGEASVGGEASAPPPAEGEGPDPKKPRLAQPPLPAPAPTAPPPVAFGPAFPLWEVDPIGFGTMPLGVGYSNLQGSSPPPRDVAVRVLLTALDAGVRLLDTADAYGPPGQPHVVESIVAEALALRPSIANEVVVATKSGFMRVSGESGGWRPAEVDPHSIARAIRASYNALGRRPIGLWQLHHFHKSLEDPGRFEKMLQAVARLVQEGVVQRIGLCNVSVAQIERARKVVQVDSVQCEYSLWKRTAEKDLPPNAKNTSAGGVLPYCQRERIPFLPHGPLGGTQARAGGKSLVKEFPGLVDIARDLGVGPHALVLAWMYQKWPCIRHIPGARTEEHVKSLQQARELIEKGLSPGTMHAIDSMKKTKMR